jgi:hypothetical protein
VNVFIFFIFYVPDLSRDMAVNSSTLPAENHYVLASSNDSSTLPGKKLYRYIARVKQVGDTKKNQCCGAGAGAGAARNRNFWPEPELEPLY